jgi:hypothetical protein
MYIYINPLKENGLPVEDRMFRVAFGMFFGLSDPMTCLRDANYISARFRDDSSAAYGAKVIDDGDNDNGIQSSK